jgi:biopolymer transport protein ExbD
MGMPIAGRNTSEPQPMLEMNMTPLIDVMLVLIIMFIITIPLQLHQVGINLPTGQVAEHQPAQVVDLVVDFDGTTYWNNVVVDASTLATRFAAVAAQPDQAEIHLRANKLAKYKFVAQVMAAAQREGVQKIGMVGNEQFI